MGVLGFWAWDEFLGRMVTDSTPTPSSQARIIIAYTSLLAEHVIEFHLPNLQPKCLIHRFYTDVQGVGSPFFYWNPCQDTFLSDFQECSSGEVGMLLLSELNL